MNYLKCFFALGLILGITHANIVDQQITEAVSQEQVSTSNPSSTQVVEGEKREKSHQFDGINQQYALVLFYQSSCPHCQAFDPILKAFSKDYGFKVYAFTTDGISLPSFPHSMPATPQVVNVFFGTPTFKVPAVFAINTESMAAYKISSGEMSFSDFTSLMLNFQQRLDGGLS